MFKYLPFLLLAVTPLRATTYANAQGFCQVGGVAVVTAAIPSTNLVQGSFPQCTVTVYVSGGTTKATIYNNPSGSTLPNPFTATQQGFWVFYAANGTYDVQISGGGLQAPFTFPALTIGGSGGSGPSPSVSLPWTDVTADPYDAKGDCTTDDGPAIQAALNVTGYVIFPNPPGGCYLTGQTLIQPQGTYVYGFSSNAPYNSPSGTKPGVTIMLKAHTNIPIWETYDASTSGSGNEFYQIQNIVFDGNGPNQDTELASTKACVNFTGTFIGTLLSHVEVTRCFGSALFNSGARIDNVWLINNTTSNYAYVHNPGASPGFGGFAYDQFFVEESMIPKAGKFNDAYTGGAINQPSQYSHAILLNGVQASMNFIHCESSLTCIDFTQSQGLTINSINENRLGNPLDPDPTNQYLIRNLNATNSDNITFTSAYYDQSGSSYGGPWQARIYGLSNNQITNDVYQTPINVAAWPFYTWGIITTSVSHAPYLGERAIVGNELWIQQIGGYSPNYIKFYGSGGTGDSGGPAWWTGGNTFGHESAPYTNELTFITMNDFSDTNMAQNTVTINGETLSLNNVDGSQRAQFQTDNSGNVNVSGNQQNFLWFGTNTYFGLNQGNHEQGTGVSVQGLSNEAHNFAGGLTANTIWNGGNWFVGANGSWASAILTTNGGPVCIFDLNGVSSGTSITQAAMLGYATDCSTSQHNFVLAPTFGDAGAGYNVSNDDTNFSGGVIANALKLLTNSGTSGSLCSATGGPGGTPIGQGTFRFVADPSHVNDSIQVCMYVASTLAWQTITVP